MEYVMQNLSEKLFMPWVNGKKTFQNQNSQIVNSLNIYIIISIAVFLTYLQTVKID